MNIIIAGGTGAGKTTLLNALSAFINGKERIVTIEDAAELQLKQPHVVRLETRPANLEGHGAVRQRELLVNSLRMRPDRIVVGEVRGEEALDMLQAMNTGHDGSLTTVHANTPRDAVSRLEVMVSLANANMQLTSIRQQIASAVHMLVQASRLSDGSRRVVSHHRGHRHGRRSGDAAGSVRVREARPRSGRQSGGPVRRHRHPAQILRKAARAPASACARICSTKWWRSEYGIPCSDRSGDLGVAMGAWFLVSKYVKSTDVDRVKDRLLGTTRPQEGKSRRKRRAASTRHHAGRSRQEPAWRRCWWRNTSWARKLQQFLEQAGLRWAPARLVNLTS